MYVYVFTIYIILVVSSVNTQNGCKSLSCEVELGTDAGRVCGRIRRADDGSEYASFRGVPYGKPPLGERRFKELEPMDPWEGVLDATEDSPACPQKNLLYGSITLQPKGMSEDCIYLNLHVPLHALPRETAGPGTKPLPILVMIHGGGFNVGSGLTDLHGPEYLMPKDVIVISFNYRLNVFGFLSLGTAEIPGNQGLRDMVTLLKWVQRNARAFGGDPDNVTIIGQSAGAAAAHLLTLSKAADGLVKRTILMSGTGINSFFTSSPYYAKAVADAFLGYLNMNTTNPADIHKQLIETPLIDIMKASSLVLQDFGAISFSPVVENVYPGVTQILDQDPLQLIVQGRGEQYPMIIGFTDKEEESFRYAAILLGLLQRVEQNPLLLLPVKLLFSVPMENLKTLAGQMYQKCFKGKPNLDKLLICVGYTYFVYPAVKLTEWRTLRGASTYLYKYTYKSERSILKEALWTNYDGAAHVEDLTYVFKVNSMIKEDDVSTPPKNNDDRMKHWMTTLVTNFMKCSNPTCSEDMSEWPAQSGQDIQYQNIAEPMVYNMMKLSHVERDMIDFYNSIDEEGRNITQILMKY